MIDYFCLHVKMSAKNSTHSAETMKWPPYAVDVHVHMHEFLPHSYQYTIYLKKRLDVS